MRPEDLLLYLDPDAVGRDPKDPATDVRVEQQGAVWFVLAPGEISRHGTFEAADLYACMLMEHLREVAGWTP